MELLGLAVAPGTDLFSLLRALSVGVFGILPPVLAAFGWRHRRQYRGWARAAFLLALAIALTGGWAFAVEPYWLQTTFHEIHAEKIARPIRVAVVADLQTDDVGNYERRVLAEVAEAAPDLILLTGDYLQIERRGLGEQSRRLQAIWKEADLNPRLGSWAVGGDVEGPGWPEIFTGLPVQTIEQSTTFSVGPVTLSALSATHSRQGSFQIDQGESFHIVFGHAPDFALASPPVDLMIAGHTHGGQVRLPLIGPLLTLSRVPRAWAAGRTDFDDGRTLMVSRGIGMERGNAPRLRFLCRPEIVIIDLLPAD